MTREWQGKNGRKVIIKVKIECDHSSKTPH